MDDFKQQLALVVSPWPTDREFVSWLIKQRGFLCREAGTLKVAILALSRDQFDLIILDHHMVEKEEEFRQIREAALTTPIILVSESTVMDIVLDDQTTFLQRGQLTYHLLEKVPGYHLEDRVLRIIETQLLRWARPVLSKVEPDITDLEMLSEIVSSWLRRCRILRTLADELIAKIRPMVVIAAITSITYFFQQWAGVIDWRSVLTGLGFDVRH